MTEMTLEAAIKLANQDSPLPSLAGPALKVLRDELAAKTAHNDLIRKWLMEPETVLVWMLRGNIALPSYKTMLDRFWPDEAKKCDVPGALRFAAQVIELWDDATMDNDYMADSGDCAAILNVLADHAGDLPGFVS
jgi:hypothetical protein